MRKTNELEIFERFPAIKEHNRQLTEITLINGLWW